jgi:hypothetical protein
MTKPTDRSDSSPLLSKGMWRVLTRASVPPALISLHRALHLSTAHNWRLDLQDIDRVESMWELLDLDSTSHGFVLSLRTGGRTYLQYVMAPGDNDEPVEKVEFLTMDRERYPDLQGGGIWWDDDVHDLNLLLRD